MTEQSDRMLMLLQELAALKELGGRGRGADAVARRKRRKEIRAEMKQLADEKKKAAKA